MLREIILQPSIALVAKLEEAGDKGKIEELTLEQQQQ
jgi:hypothetical protein